MWMGEGICVNAKSNFVTQPDALLVLLFSVESHKVCGWVGSLRSYLGILILLGFQKLTVVHRPSSATQNSVSSVLTVNIRSRFNWSIPPFLVSPPLLPPSPFQVISSITNGQRQDDQLCRLFSRTFTFPHENKLNPQTKTNQVRKVNFSLFMRNIIE